MTIDEAIRIIKIVLAVAEDFEITVQGEELTKEKCKEAVEIVTKALEQEPGKDAIKYFNTIYELSQTLGVSYSFIADEIKEIEKALKALPQEPCTDMISRREAIKKITYNGKGECIPDYDCENFPTQIAKKTVKKILRELPSITPVGKVGHWIYDDDCREHGHYSECGYGSIDIVDGKPHNYCQNCGTKMQIKKR